MFNNEDDGSNEYNTSREEDKKEQKPPEIEQVDPKRAFLDQLAATLKQKTTTGANTSSSSAATATGATNAMTAATTGGAKKFAKNKSDVNKSNGAANSEQNFSDDTQLMARYAFGSMNNGETVAASSRGDTDAKTNHVPANFIDDDDDDNENIPRHSSFRRRVNMNKIGICRK